MTDLLQALFSHSQNDSWQPMGSEADLRSFLLKKALAGLVPESKEIAASF